MNIKKNDTVIVLSGKSKGKKGVRVGFKLDGDKKVRVCKKCGKEI